MRVSGGEVIETIHGPGCTAVTGYRPEDYVSEPDLWYSMVYKKDREKVTEQSSSALKGEDVQPLEHRIVHLDGTVRWVRNTIILLKNENGELYAYNGLINDITELKKAEDRDRLTQQQLLQADKMATIGILVSGVAHEINNPNNFIKLNARMIEKTWNGAKPVLENYFQQHGDFALAGIPYSRAKDKISTLITGISKGSIRIENIVRGLKDYAKQDPGDVDQEINLNKVVKAAILIVNNLIKKSTDSFSVDYWNELPSVRGNFQNLEQVLINLITNSCQALTASPKSISINTLFDSDKNKIRVRVTDSGAGINDQQMKHIFDPFFTTKRENGGTGLGLSIAYNIVKNHDGELHFESKQKGGTTATLILPASTSALSN